METGYLPNREAVIDRSMQLMNQAKHQWIGMGRTAAWIKHPEFRKAVANARSRNVAFKIIIFYEGDAHTHCRSWLDMGAEVGFFEHGYIRTIIVDDDEAIVAFPKVVTSLAEDREYFGFHISGVTPVSELLNYFKQIWEQSEKLQPEVVVSERRQGRAKTDKALFAAGVLRFIIRVIRRAFPEWFPGGD